MRTYVLAEKLLHANRHSSVTVLFACTFHVANTRNFGQVLKCFKKKKRARVLPDDDKHRGIF